MALHLPPSLSVQKFTGGYKAVSDYTDLADTETNDALNTVYGPNGDIDQREGSERLYPTRLFNTSTLSATTFSAGEPITGHYYFDKLGSTSVFHIIGAGNSLYQYTSSTASVIRTGLTDSSNAFFSFIQIADPRSAANEIALMTNGVDAIQAWDGSGTATTLSAFTSASAVPICKILISHKERVYAVNIVDATDSDSPVRVDVSGFGSDGAPDPHRFGSVAGGGSFFCGGAGRQGPIQNAKVLNDQIVFYTRKSVWKFSPGSGNSLDTSSLVEVQDAKGLLAPLSLVSVGDFHIGLYEQGIHAFDGVNFVHLSEKMDEEIFKNSNLSQLQYAKGVYFKRDNQYILYYPSSGSTRNDRAIIYDLREGMKCWQPPVTGRQVSYVSTFDTSDGVEEVIYGDYLGYLYQDHQGTNDGIETGFNGTVVSANYSTLTETSATFTTTNDGLSGLMVHIYEGTGEGQSRIVASNTADTLTLESDWKIIPDTTSKYCVAGIQSHWRSKDYHFGTHDLEKLFRHIRARVREQGNFNLDLHYIVDFKELSRATKKAMLLWDGGWAWGKSIWGQDRWGAKPTIRKKVSLRNTPAQSTNGTHLALRFSNLKANETWRLSGYDIEANFQVGRR